MTTEELRLLIRSRLLECDQDGLSVVMVTAAFDTAVLGTDLSAEAIANEELAKMPHEVQEYWTGQCNCDGHLN